ncbi:hypothetical protein OG594_02665 [Streptomyces sp. NBC_01214]|uniref:hypothetical protein n=1 Tax=Streptomyces sp. NBC_01214 TaxID=2903777 RepID=UPI0022581094|nr:hypothetical protein [Streptomyces sp. NBC_01214]MCX4800584.1 hypothetical protein [Streptomyces sp. NBC_01214]
MTDSTTQRLWDRLMDGTAPSRFETPKPKGDRRSAEILDRLHGDTDYSHVHESNAKGQREHEAALRQRTAKLQGEGMTSHYAEAKARRQLAAELDHKHYQDNQRRAYDQMVASNRAESEAKSTKRLGEEVRQTAAPRRSEEGFQRLVDAVLAEIRTKS